MPKKSASETAITRQNIVKKASAVFRANGSAAAIGALMNDLGLTHGGFYRHFESKEELLIEAVANAIEEIATRLVRVAEGAPSGRRLEAIITAYLSSDHVEHPEAWCALAALSGDIARLPTAVRARLDGAWQSYMNQLAPYMPGETLEQRQAQFVVLLSGMAGAISMVRAMGDEAMRLQVLELTREHHLNLFAAGKR